jgi:hypothetical protein
MAPDLSVIIVSYRCRDVLAGCLKSLEPQSAGAATQRRPEAAGEWPAIETIVVDNASGDGTLEMVRREFPSVRLIANDANRGFAAANNQGLAAASGRHVLFLNPDTIVQAGALAALVGILDGDEAIGACGPQVLNSDGSVQPSARAFPGYGALLHQYTPLRLLRIFRDDYRRYKMADFDFLTAADVDSLMGAALCVRRRVIDKVGNFDERFFVYLEEVDLCRRIREAGYRVRFDPAGRVVHLGGVSAAAATANLFFCRSLFRYIRKYHSPVAGAAMVHVLRLGMWIREAGMLVGNLAAAAGLAVIGRTDGAQRRWAAARSAARFVARDSWASMAKV